MTYTTTRAIMTAAELDAHKSAEHGRDYRLSDDGYGDMEVAERRGWTVIASWGHDGWNLGDWPYVMIYVRDIRVPPCDTCGANLTDGSGDGVNGHWQNCSNPVRYRNSGRYQLQQACEGDHTLYQFDNQTDREAAIDYLFLWYAAGESWAPLTYEDRARLDAGELDVPGKFRGPCRI